MNLSHRLTLSTVTLTGLLLSAMIKCNKCKFKKIIVIKSLTIKPKLTKYLTQESNKNKMTRVR